MRMWRDVSYFTTKWRTLYIIKIKPGRNVGLFFKQKTMIKCRLHIFNPATAMDEEVYAECLLPAVPEIGSSLHMTPECENQIESMARESIDVAEKYYPEWFYGIIDKTKDLELKDLEHLSFGDAIYVIAVTYKTNNEWVDIELHDYWIHPDKEFDENNRKKSNHES